MRILFIILATWFLSVTDGVAANTSTETVTVAKPPLTLTQQEKWRLMIGKWYGSQPTKEGGVKKWIVERMSPGTYKIVFRIYEKDATSYWEQIEVGEWGVSGPVYFSILRGWVKDGKLTPADPTDPFNYDAYKIISLTDEKFEYENYDSGDVYGIKKVPISFDFPDDS